MAKLPVDLTKVEAAGDFPVYPEGSYTLEVLKADQSIAKSSGQPKLQVQFSIIDGPDGSNEWSGRSLVRSYSLSEKALPFLRRFAEACGVDSNMLSDFDDQLLIGAKIRAMITQQEYQGRMTNQVNSEVALNGQSNIAPAPTGLTPA